MPMRKRLVAGIALVVLLAAALQSAGRAVAAPSGTPHYPDLRTTRKFLARRLQITHESGRKLLRFSNNVRNEGDGPLELFPVNDPETATTDAYQRVYSHTASGSWYVVSEELVGTFAFHVAHNHWHFGDFAAYELHAALAGGGVGALVGTASKVSFCVNDSKLMNPNLEHSSRQSVYLASNCDQNGVQGQSVGWGDTYKYTLADQSIDITSVPDGIYWLISTADPDNRIAETNDANNATRLKIQIAGDTVTNLS
jgi:hypothetical protein